jgi:hypothetical protein
MNIITYIAIYLIIAAHGINAGLIFLLVLLFAVSSDVFPNVSYLAMPSTSFFLRLPLFVGYVRCTPLCRHCICSSLIFGYLLRRVSFVFSWRPFLIELPYVGVYKGKVSKHKNL